ncbi:MAG: hypothetical protein WA001_02155 [Patescibacteria group bacterium]
MSNPVAEAAVLRTVAFHEAWNYLPTTTELLDSLDVAKSGSVSWEDAERALDGLVRSGELLLDADRVGLPATFADRLFELHERDPLQARKRRRAVRIARYLSRLSGVRFVALANTTALGTARDGSDLDFFVIVRAGTIWSTRLLSAGLFKLAGLLPKGDEIPDAVCLSYFIADDALDLSSHALPDGDPYFRQWFLALLPLFDDGISQELWDANSLLRQRHPFARRWIVPPDLHISTPRLRIPTARPIEALARGFQLRWFPAEIKQRMNQDTTVIVTDQALKFHVGDGRVWYRDRQATICHEFGIDV